MNQPWHESVRLVDMHYIAPQKAASYILLEGGRAMIIDNTNQAIPHLEAELQRHGLGWEHVDYLVITHVHLDHAGGTGPLARLCPQATVLCHPKAARHLVNPERLILGSKGVYGEELFNELYGEIVPVAEGQVRSMADGEVLEWGSRRLRFEHALGHATHHFVVYDNVSKGVFTGDVLGAGRTRFIQGGEDWVHCVTAPPDFDAEEQKKASQRLADSGAQWAFIAHYGVFDNIPARVRELHRSLERAQAIVEAAAASGMDDAELTPWCIEQQGLAIDEHLRELGVEDFETARRTMDGDQFINGLGLGHAAQRLRQKAAAAG